MAEPISRRDVLKGAAASALAAVPLGVPQPVEASPPGWVCGKLTGAAALVEALKTEGVDWVFGIPGAQQNELWDEMKNRCLGYMLCTHEYSAAVMADGYSRSTGRTGVLCIVPGPGVTNALTGLGESLLDSIPVVAVVGDVAIGDKYHPFQVHALPNAALLKPVCKFVIEVAHVGQIPFAVRDAFQIANKGEPGPVAVVVPYNMLTEVCKFQCPPPGPREVPFDPAAFQAALALLESVEGKRLKPYSIGIYAGQGCMDCGHLLTRVAELLQAPVATSISGKGVIDECHPLAVGWGYGPQGTRTAELAFCGIDLILAIGVKFSEVSTGYYSDPQAKRLIQVDANPDNIGKVLKADVCVHADAAVFLERLLGHADELRRPPSPGLVASIKGWKEAEAAENAKVYPTCAVDPMVFLLALRRLTCPDTLVFVDVTMTEHWSGVVFTTTKPRTYFNPTNNQAMGWSIPAALGAQRANPGKLCVTVTGDGCFLMTGLEMSTAARECLPVKFFILDDHAFHYMQTLQKAAYKRTTATILAPIDYAAYAKALNLGYVELRGPDDLEPGIKHALEMPGPVLVRVVTDYGPRPCRWISATKKRYIGELSTSQKIRMLARVGARSLNGHPDND